jgi:hypothetical protein
MPEAFRKIPVRGAARGSLWDCCTWGDLRAGCVAHCSEKRRQCIGSAPEFCLASGAPSRFLCQGQAGNEQGVVLLFGMLAKQPGFLIEVVQKGFPDCEAKRQIGPEQWQRVGIEFEFESRTFRVTGILCMAATALSAGGTIVEYLAKYSKTSYAWDNFSPSSRRPPFGLGLEQRKSGSGAAALQSLRRYDCFNEPQRWRIPMLASPRRANRDALAEFFDFRAWGEHDLSKKPQTIADRDRSRWKFP